jgi:excisionase family DNA binding protein
LTCVLSALAARVAAAPAPTPRSATAATDRKKWLTADEVAERLGVTRRWVYAHARELEAQRLSRKCLRVPQRAVERRLAEDRS